MIGALCVLDPAPRELSVDQRDALRVLAGQVVAQLELRRHRRQESESSGEKLLLEVAGLSQPKDPDRWLSRATPSSSSKTMRTTRDGLVSLLEAEGFPVRSAGNGREALDLLESAAVAPRLILLDLMMPVMDGWQFLAERRRRPAGVALDRGAPVRSRLHRGRDRRRGLHPQADRSFGAAVLRAQVLRSCG